MGVFSIHLLSESPIHMPGILIQNLSERPIHIARNPQILTFPEMCLPGYFTPLEGSVEQAIAANHSLSDEAGKGEYLTALQDAAARSKMVLAFGFAEKAGKEYFDAVGVIDATGEWLGVRRKNPLYPMDHEIKSFSQPDHSLRSVVMQTRYGKVGIACCFDGLAFEIHPQIP